MILNYIMKQTVVVDSTYGFTKMYILKLKYLIPLWLKLT